MKAVSYDFPYSDDPRAMLKHANFSSCGNYRYSLSRVWAPGTTCLWIMLNPSTADETEDDPTIRRCIGFSRRWGFSGLHVVNLFAWRSTCPKALNEVRNPVGPDNDAFIDFVSRHPGFCVGETVFAWGSRGSLLNRDRQVASMFRMARCLGKSKQGHPRHPLYMGYDVPLQPWEVHETDD